MQGASVIKHLGSPYQAGGLPGKCAFQSALYTHCGHRDVFPNLQTKPLSEENIRKATAILTNQIYDWNQIADTKGYENTQSRKV